MNTESTPREKIQTAAQALGLTIEAQFVPFSQSRNKNEKQPSLNWIVTLKRNGRDILTTDYGAGCAHCPSYNKKPPHAWDRPDSMWQPTVLRWECENGFAATFTTFGFSKSNIPNRLNPIQPDMVDVLCSLASDSDVIDAGGFESWASDFGYDTDSRKAESIYRACLDIALKLRAAIGDDGLRQLREACQDY